MLVREGVARAGFQIAFESEGLAFTREREIGVETPRLEVRGADVFAGVVVGKPLPEVIGVTGVAVIGE